MQYHGPWVSATEYLKSVVCREIEWINTHAKSQKPIKRPWQFVSPVQDDPKVHTSLLQNYISAIPGITPKDPELVCSRLWHPDFHAGNIYVDADYRISSIIDWQGAWATPPFLGANPPSLLHYSIDMMMFLPENFKTLDDAMKEQLRYQVAQSIMIHTYETSTRKQNPVMFKVMHLPHGSTLKQLEAFANSTWDNTLFPFEECLIRMEREWEAFNTNTTCPYQFTQEELERHNDEIEPFNNSQEF
ncbi:Phosphotransferase enzyme [Epicoccum nigrum]|nr:Phosphotransferase enzyme [Epicoccum nigrum]